MHDICHVEFHVTDISRSQAFYEGLFGWSFRSFGDDMVVFGQGDKHIGGLQKDAHVKPGSSPSVWFEVASIDAMVEKAVEFGGSIIEPKHPVPHVGWSAQIADPDGNLVGMVQFER